MQLPNDIHRLQYLGTELAAFQVLGEIKRTLSKYYVSVSNQKVKTCKVVVITW